MIDFIKKNKLTLIISLSLFLGVLVLIGIKFFSEESQNSFIRKMDTTFGMKNGCVEVFFGNDKAVKRFFNVEKLSTALGTYDDKPRPYRYGYGYYDVNLNNKLDDFEKKLGKNYFEVGDYSQYIYFVKPKI